MSFNSWPPGYTKVLFFGGRWRLFPTEVGREATGCVDAGAFLQR